MSSNKRKMRMRRIRVRVRSWWMSKILGWILCWRGSRLKVALGACGLI